MATSRALCGLAVVISSALLCPQITHAQTPPDVLTQAQVLYDDAAALMDRDEITDACPKLEQVIRLVPDGLGAKMTLAECYEREGKLASAWELYWAAATAAGKAGQVERQVRCSFKALTIRPRLATITIRIADPILRIDGLTVKKDGVLIEKSQWSEKIPVDIGDHTIDVEAPGRGTWQRAVHIERDGKSQEVAIDATMPEQEPEATSQVRAWQRPSGYAIGTTGVVSLALGAIFGGVAVSKAHTANKECSPTLVCSQDGFNAHQSGRTFGNASTALLVIGGVATTAGIVLVVTAPKKPVTEVGIGPGFVSLSGHF